MFSCVLCFDYNNTIKTRFISLCLFHTRTPYFIEPYVSIHANWIWLVFCFYCCTLEWTSLNLWWHFGNLSSPQQKKCCHRFNGVHCSVHTITISRFLLQYKIWWQISCFSFMNKLSNNWIQAAYVCPMKERWKRDMESMKWDNRKFLLLKLEI